MIYKTLYGNPLDFSKICDIDMNGEIKFTYLLFGVYMQGTRSYFKSVCVGGGGGGGG